MTIGQFIKDTRDVLCISGKSLAEQMQSRGFSGWYQTTVSRVELGDRGLTLDEAFAVADILSVDIESLRSEDAKLALIEAANRRVAAAQAELDEAYRALHLLTDREARSAS